MTRKACPFCGCNHSRRVRNSEYTIEDREVILYYIECCYCHTRTDEYYAVKKAEEAWRKRCGFSS